MSKSAQGRKVVLVVGAIIALWYASILPFPELADGHGVPSLPMTVQHTMVQLSLHQPSYNGAKAQLDQWGWTRSAKQGTYQFTLSRHPSAAWELVARPDRTFVYHYPLWKRILWADFYKHKWDAYRIRAGEGYPEEIE